MEQEDKKTSNATLTDIDGVTDPPAFDEEHTFCNCENNECLIPYQSDESISDVLPLAEQCDVEEPLDQPHHPRCDCAPKNTAQRLKKDLMKAGNHPYIKREHTCHIGLYRKKNDTEPIDCFEANTSHTLSARGMLLLGIAVFGVCLFKRLLDKDQ